jgi:hypothetical protein
VSVVSETPRSVLSPAKPSEGPSPGVPMAWIVVGLAAAAGVATFHVWVLVGRGTPAGIDTGNWLAFGNRVFGADVRPDGLAYPPVIPMLVAVAAAALGPTVGVATVGAISGLMPALAAFLVLRWGGLGTWAIVLAIFLLPQTALGEIMSWGGFPQLMATPFVVMFLWLLDRWISSRDGRALVGAAAAGALVLATSHFSALIAALSGALIIANRVVTPHPFVNRSQTIRRAAGGLGLTLLFALPLAPTYARLVPAVAATSISGEPSTAIPWEQLPQRFATIHGIISLFLVLGVLAALAGVVLPPARRHDALWSLNAALLTAVAATFLLTREPRVLYEVPLVAAIGVGTCLRELRERSPAGRRRAFTTAVCVGVVGAVCVATIAGVSEFARQRKTYGIVNGDTVAAADWLRDHTPEGSVVAVTSVESAPLGWWVEALSRRRTLVQSPPRWLLFPEERRIARQVNEVFVGLEHRLETGFQEARRRGIDYLFIAKGTPTYELTRSELAHEVRPAFESRKVLILEVPGGSV